MTKDYGRPLRAEDSRTMVEVRLKELSEAGGTRETVTVEWRGKPSSFDVIEMPVGDLYYNPATHRIKAQRSLDADRDALLEADPWSVESQQYLDFLLKALPADPSHTDPEFAKLADSLAEYGQNDAGLITRDGVLVNGNTRRAALLERHGPAAVMRVGVLPASCGWNDVAAVELALQLRKDHRREYSYINRLLAIDELVSQGITLPEIAKTFRTTQEACRRDLWIYNLIQNLVRRSEANGRALPLMAFEDHSEKLRELHRKVAKEAAKGPEKADLMLEVRLAATMLGFAKTDLRLIEGDFHDRYLADALPSELKPTPVPAGTVSIPGLGRSVKGPSAGISAARQMTDAILQARAVASAHLPAESEEVAKSATTLNAYREAFDSSLQFAGKDARVRKRKQAAPTRLVDASQAIDQCVTDLVMSRASRSLDEDAFDDAATKLRRSLGKLALEIKRTVSEPGDDTSWLIGLLDKEI
ncbi:transcriptional regulator [Kitasatospora sp. NPDC051853]|uniref:transcriptional regulator n=1 Tax=Kitasatospora sp. NPDC051853 TaxID=3364058 RepID=UPI0037B20943